MIASDFPLVDSHCHLAWPDFERDLDQVVARMREAGIAHAVAVATDPDSGHRCAALAKRFAFLHPTAGIHPNDLPADWEKWFADIEAQHDDGVYCAVGETGLDYYRDSSPIERQREAFARHADLARSRDVPLIVHIREKDGRWGAYDDVASILGSSQGVRGVIHCYTGDVAHAERYLELGFCVSFSGIVTFPKAENVREAARAVPLDRLLIETDAPFLAPEPWRGKRNEPSYLAATAKRLAEVKGVAEGELRKATTANALRLFGIQER